jgi:hypothetical protein
VTYQLVIQARGDALADYDVIIAIEDRLISAMDSVGDVDGHDVGSGETNVFILAEDPKAAFARALPVLEEFGVLDRTRAAYRRIGDDAYTSVWPLDSQEEFAIP